MADTLEAPSPRRHKSKDYRTVALKAAQATLARQADAHVAVLEALDAVADAAAAVTHARTAHTAALEAQAAQVTAMVELVGLDETAARLELSTGQVRTLCRKPTRTGAEAGTGQTASADLDDDSRT